MFVLRSWPPSLQCLPLLSPHTLLTVHRSRSEGVPPQLVWQLRLSSIPGSSLCAEDVVNFVGNVSSITAQAVGFGSRRLQSLTVLVMEVMRYASLVLSQRDSDHLQLLTESDGTN
jgi:hypothetical protein